MDGRGLVPQVDSKLLYEASVVIAREVCTSGSCPWAPVQSLSPLTIHPLTTAHPGLVVEGTPLVIVLKPLLLASCFAHLVGTHRGWAAGCSF